MKQNKKTYLILAAVAIVLLLCLIFPGVRNAVFGLLFDSPEETSAVTEAEDTRTPTTKAPDTTKSPVSTKTPDSTKTPASTSSPTTKTPVTTAAPEPKIREDGIYDAKEDVALYIHTYGKLPKNFITKAEAEALGWPGNRKLDDYAKDKCIGGDYFGNMEGLLPTKKGRKYTECDIDTLHKKERGVKRIVFSNDGLIFYTDDHYEHFTQLY